jgi:hypothetical protein
MDGVASARRPRRIVARAKGRPITHMNDKRVYMGAIREVDEVLEDAASML